MTKAIATAIDRIVAVDPELGRYLVSAVHTGAECSYRPTEAAPHWVLE